MSYRGSFVTEYIYCNKCFQAAKGVLLIREKGLCSVVVPHWNHEIEGKELPIIAGKLGSLSFGGEVEIIQCEIAPELAKVICHPMRIAVLNEARHDYDAVTIVVHPIQSESDGEGEAG